VWFLQVSSKLAEAMKEAGCHQAYLGFESGSDEMLKFIRKGATVAALEVKVVHRVIACVAHLVRLHVRHKVVQACDLKRHHYAHTYYCLPVYMHTCITGVTVVHTWIQAYMYAV
jgi:hypothetical protein